MCTFEAIILIQKIIDLHVYCTHVRGRKFIYICVMYSYYISLCRCNCFPCLVTWPLLELLFQFSIFSRFVLEEFNQRKFIFAIDSDFRRIKWFNINRTCLQYMESPFQKTILFLWNMRFLNNDHVVTRTWQLICNIKGNIFNNQIIFLPTYVTG